MAMEICQNETVKDILKCSKKEPIPVKAKDTLIKGDAAMMGYIGVALQVCFIVALIYAISDRCIFFEDMAFMVFLRFF